MTSVEYNIQVNNDVVTVKTTLGAGKLKKGHMVTFKSNDPNTTIRFDGTSPFLDLPAGKELVIGTAGQGPFKVAIAGDHHFDCGHIVNKVFTNWAGGGAHTPVED